MVGKSLCSLQWCKTPDRIPKWFNTTKNITRERTQSGRDKHQQRPWLQHTLTALGTRYCSSRKQDQISYSITNTSALKVSDNRLMDILLHFIEYCCKGDVYIIYKILSLWSNYNVSPNVLEGFLHQVAIRFFMTNFHPLYDPRNSSDPFCSCAFKTSVIKPSVNVKWVTALCCAHKMWVCCRVQFSWQQWCVSRSFWMNFNDLCRFCKKVFLDWVLNFCIGHWILFF